MGEFHLRGPVPLGAAAYVNRAFEAQIETELAADRWVLLLGPRQHGKTSGLIRVKAWLSESGFLPLRVDLQALPPVENYEEITEWFARQVAGQVGIAEFDMPPEAQRRNLVNWLETVIPADSPPIVLLVDEASGIANVEYRNAFFGQIRAIANQRPEEPPGSVLRSIRFVFSGTFRPELLVDERNSPFNVCEVIRTDSLTQDQAQALWAQAVDGADEGVVAAAYESVGGQPYLLQVLFSRAANAEPGERLGEMQAGLDELRSGSDAHFEGIFSRIVADSALSNIVASMSADGSVPNEPANSHQTYLMTLGLVERQDEILAFSNELYAEIAATSIQIELDAEVPARGAQLYPIPESDLSHMQDGRYRELAHRSYNGAVNAYRGGSYRLALAGFGASMEAILIDFLDSLDPDKLRAAIAEANLSLNQFENATQPSTFRLVNLLKVAGSVEQVTTPREVNEPVREWRNHIHPAVAMQDFRPEEALEPEARVSSGLLSALIRDIRRLA